jgi:hypothetical protein
MSPCSTARCSGVTAPTGFFLQSAVNRMSAKNKHSNFICFILRCFYDKIPESKSPGKHEIKKRQLRYADCLYFIICDFVDSVLAIVWQPQSRRLWGWYGEIGHPQSSLEAAAIFLFIHVLNC